MAHKLQLVRVLPFAEAGTVFSCVCPSDVVFHGLAAGEGAAFGFGAKAGVATSRDSDVAASAAGFCLPN